MPDLAGKIENKAHALTIRVYYEDTDFSGAVYHANYLKYCERGRSDCLRLIGIHHHELHDGSHWHETEGQMGFVVRRMECDFLASARIDDVITVESRFVEARGARIELQQRVLCGETILFDAKVTVALIGKDGKPKRLPAWMLEAFEELF